MATLSPDELLRKRLLDEARRARGWTQRRLAGELGVSVGLVASWARKDGPAPPVERYLACARLLDAPEMVAALVADLGWHVGPPGGELAAARAWYAAAPPELRARPA